MPNLISQLQAVQAELATAKAALEQSLSLETKVTELTAQLASRDEQIASLTRDLEAATAPSAAESARITELLAQVEGLQAQLSTAANTEQDLEARANARAQAILAEAGTPPVAMTATAAPADQRTSPGDLLAEFHRLEKQDPAQATAFFRANKQDLLAQMSEASRRKSPQN